MGGWARHAAHPPTGLYRDHTPVIHEAPATLPLLRAPPAPAQERMHVVWQEMVNSGLLSPSDFVRVTSTAAAQVFHVYPRKGVVSFAEPSCWQPHPLRVMLLRSVQLCVHCPALHFSIYVRKGMVRWWMIRVHGHVTTVVPLTCCLHQHLLLARTATACSAADQLLPKPHAPPGCGGQRRRRHHL